MKFTLLWLERFLDITGISVDKITTALTALGMEVENVTLPNDALKSFVVGEVLEKTKHPNADSLSLCKVSNGSQTLQIVCGAPNVRAGIKIVLAQVGTLIPNGNFKIKKAKIRGEESEGMICSLDELGIGVDDGNILELDNATQLGKPFIEECPWAFDTKIEISVTPNRPDWLGVYGIARDLAAYGIGKLKTPKIPAKQQTNNSGPITLKVDDESACPLFVGQYISGIDNAKPTKLALKTLLYLIGEKSISPVVDITNYINYSFGRPMHAYDADKIDGAQLQVRFAKNNESMLPLGADDKQIALNKEDLVVADGAKICALAGVIGDERSKCTATTQNILLEAAVFRADLVYKTGRHHGINTESRHRFERGVDVNYTEPGLRLASEMILEQCGGTLHDVVVVGQSKQSDRTIDFDFAKIFKLTGVQIGLEQTLEILTSLGFKCEKADKIIKVVVPSHRHDINRQEDLIEEVVRVNGYDKIPFDPMPHGTSNLEYETIPQANTTQFNIRKVLASFGYDEVMTWSFMPSKLAASLNLENAKLRIANPLSNEMDILRPSLLPNLLECIIKNNARSFKNLSLFEIGTVFNADGTETNMLCGVRSGNISDENIYKDSRPFDSFDLKSDLTNMLAAVFNISVDDLKFVERAGQCYHPNQSALILLNERQIGQIGVVHPTVLNAMDITSSTIAFEILMDSLEMQPKRPLFSQSNYQPVTRDFAFIVDDKVPAQALIDAIKAADKSNLIQQISIFDVFTSAEFGEHKKSIAIRIMLQAFDRTLTAEEIDAFSNAVTKSVCDEIKSASLRKDASVE